MKKQPYALYYLLGFVGYMLLMFRIITLSIPESKPPTHAQKCEFLSEKHRPKGCSVEYNSDRVSPVTGMIRKYRDE